MKGEHGIWVLSNAEEAARAISGSPRKHSKKKGFVLLSCSQHTHLIQKAQQKLDTVRLSPGSTHKKKGAGTKTGAGQSF